MRNLLLSATRWVVHVSEVFGFLSAMCIMAMVLAMTADVIMRKFAGHPIPGVLELTQLLLVATVFLALSITAVKDLHVRIDLVLKRVNPRARLCLELASRVIVIAIGIALAIQTGRQAVISIQAGEFDMGLMRFPVWPSRIALFAGIVLFDMYFVLDFVRMVFQPSQKKPD